MFANATTTLTANAASLPTTFNLAACLRDLTEAGESTVVAGSSFPGFPPARDLTVRFQRQGGANGNVTVDTVPTRVALTIPPAEGAKRCFRYEASESLGTLDSDLYVPGKARAWLSVQEFPERVGGCVDVEAKSIVVDANRETGEMKLEYNSLGLPLSRAWRSTPFVEATLRSVGVPASATAQAFSRVPVTAIQGVAPVRTAATPNPPMPLFETDRIPHEDPQETLEALDLALTARVPGIQHVEANFSRRNLALNADAWAIGLQSRPMDHLTIVSNLYDRTRATLGFRGFPEQFFANVTAGSAIVFAYEANRGIDDMNATLRFADGTGPEFLGRSLSTLLADARGLPPSLEFSAYPPNNITGSGSKLSLVGGHIEALRVGILLNPAFRPSDPQQGSSPRCTPDQDAEIRVPGGVNDLLIAVTDHGAITMKTPEDDEEVYIGSDARQVNYFVRVLMAEYFEVLKTCIGISVAQDGRYQGALHLTSADAEGDDGLSRGLEVKINPGPNRVSLRRYSNVLAISDAFTSRSMKIVGKATGNSTSDVPFLIEVGTRRSGEIIVDLDQLIPSGGHVQVP